jgi:hypothetical protein
MGWCLALAAILLGQLRGLGERVQQSTLPFNLSMAGEMITAGRSIRLRYVRQSGPGVSYCGDWGRA